MSEEKSHVEPVKIDVPSRISDVPDAKVPNVPPARNWEVDREELNRQIKADRKLKKGAGMFDGIKRKAGQKVGEWLMAILLAAARWLRDMLLDVFLSFGVYKKNEDGTPRQRRDESGKLVFTKNGDPVYEIAWGATLLAVLAKWRYEIAVLGVWLDWQIGGQSLYHWLERLVALTGW